MENFSLVLMGVFSVAADDLMKEYNLWVMQEWRKFTDYAAEVVRDELPSPGEISKAGAGQWPGTVENPGVNWATGALKRSVVRGSRNRGGFYRMDVGVYAQSVGPTLPYASTYANGDPAIPSYHGYDFIGAAQKRLDAANIINWT